MASATGACRCLAVLGSGFQSRLARCRRSLAGEAPCFDEPFPAAVTEPPLCCQAPIIVWDFETGKILHKLELHKVLVQSLAFSCGDEYLATIGGQVRAEGLCGVCACGYLCLYFPQKRGRVQRCVSPSATLTLAGAAVS